jgi:processive 1,2-diacylglycerol beta-glucosyltransferase
VQEKKPVSMATGRQAKILILSASVGGGHLRAAEAMELALHRAAPGASIRNIDVLTLANKAFRRIYGKGYLDVASRAPHFLGYVYDLLDRPREKEGEFEPDRLRVALEKLNMHPFLRLLRSETWDMVVNTHFLPAEIIGSLRASGQISVLQVTVTTDFMTHRLWVQEPCEHYFVATAESGVYLNSYGVHRERISVTGIPIQPFRMQSGPGPQRRPPDRPAPFRGLRRRAGRADPSRGTDDRVSDRSSRGLRPK